MQTRRVLPVAVLGVILAIASLVTTLASAQGTPGPITITGEAAIIEVGETTEIDFMISTPPGSTGYGAFTIDVHYDISKVVAERDCVAGRATCNGNVNSASGGPGLLRMTDASLAGVKEGLLGRFRFLGLSPGAVSFTYTVVTCADPEGSPLSGCSGTGGGIQVEGGAGYTPVATSTNTPAATPTLATPASATNTPTRTATATKTPTGSATATKTATPTMTATPTKTPIPGFPFRLYAPMVSCDGAACDVALP